MYIRFVWDSVSRMRKHPETRTTFFFLILLLAFSFYQFFLGVSTHNTLILIDALFTVFHVACSLLTSSEVSMRSSPKSFPYSYGFGRLEVLLDFGIALFTMFVYLFVVAESALILIAPDLFSHGDSHSSSGKMSASILLVPILSFLLKVVAYSLSSHRFGSSGRVSRYNVSAHEHKHLVQTKEPAQIVEESRVSMVVLLGLLNQYYGFLSFGTLDGILCGIIAIFSIWPLFRSSGAVLLQAVPVTELAPLDRARREVLGIDGVIEVLEQKYWVQTPGDSVLTSRIKIKKDSNETLILSEARTIYDRIATNLTIELDADKDSITTHPFNTSVLVE